MTTLSEIKEVYAIGAKRLRNNIFFLKVLLVSIIIYLAALVVAGAVFYHYSPVFKVLVLTIGSMAISYPKDLDAWEAPIRKAFQGYSIDNFIFYLVLVFLFVSCIKLVADYVRLGWYNVQFEYAKHGASSISTFFCRPGRFIRYFFATKVYEFFNMWSLALLMFYLFFVVASLPVFDDMKIPFYQTMRSAIFSMPVETFGVALAVYILFFNLLSYVFGYTLKYYSYFIIEEDAGPFSALKKSYRVVKDDEEERKQR